MTVIEQEDTYILQLRDNIVAKGGAGLIGCFGGQIEANETPRAAAVRELGEETTLQLKSNTLQALGTVMVVSDRDNQPVRVHADIFHVEVDSSVSIQAKEGRLVYLEKGEVAQRLRDMTTGTRAAFTQLILKEE